MKTFSNKKISQEKSIVSRHTIRNDKGKISCQRNTIIKKEGSPETVKTKVHTEHFSAFNCSKGELN